jgi:lipid-binding SYLF domain-containing protein
MREDLMNIVRMGFALALAFAALNGAAYAAGWDPEGETKALEAAQETIAVFKSTDPGLEKYFKQAYGFAVFPTIGKGGFWFAGAFGRGVLFEKGAPVGRTTVKQVTFGLQIGGQSFSELIFFKDKAALDRFKAGTSEFSAQASAVVAREGAAATTSYDAEGVAVFVHIKGGAMLEASVGGQKFDYVAGMSD